MCCSTHQALRIDCLHQNIRWQQQHEPLVLAAPAALKPPVVVLLWNLLQGAIPFAVAALVVRPDPGVLYIYIAARIAENALNHSGIDSLLLDLVTLKTLPFRARAAFHDAHHKYCNHAYKASNYGESFWLWDWAFGTLCPLSGRAASKTAAAAAEAAAAAVGPGGRAE
jgi:sterol desaturase/sphingolipid hydroxylase (fatty acid hydroxylase superfamily)